MLVLILVLAGSLLEQVAGFVPAPDISSVVAGPRQWTFLCAVPCIAISCLPSVDSLVNLSPLIAALLMFVLLVVLTFALTTGERPWGAPWRVAPLADEGLPISFGILLFGFSSHVELPSIRHSMTEPRHLQGALTLALVASALLKLVIGLGVSGSLATVPEVPTEVLPTEGLTRSAVAGFLTVSIALYFALLIFVVSPVSRRHRVVLAMCAVVMASTLPHFALAMGLFGSLCGAFLCFTAPCLCRAIFNWKRGRGCASRITTFVDVLIALFGIVIGIWGTLRAIASLIVWPGSMLI